jgi:hypothetical protein
MKIEQRRWLIVGLIGLVVLLVVGFFVLTLLPGLQGLISSH